MASIRPICFYNTPSLLLVRETTPVVAETPKNRYDSLESRISEWYKVLNSATHPIETQPIRRVGSNIAAKKSR